MVTKHSFQHSWLEWPTRIDITVYCRISAVCRK